MLSVSMASVSGGSMLPPLASLRHFQFARLFHEELPLFVGSIGKWQSSTRQGSLVLDER